MLTDDRNTRLDKYLGNMGFKLILFQGGQIGLQSDFLVLDAQLGPDVVAVEIDRALRQVHRFCDLLGGVDAENKDRRILYQEVAKALKIEPTQTDRVADDLR